MRCLRANALWNDSKRGPDDPASTSHVEGTRGLYVYDDGPGFASGGLRLFRWFTNRPKAVSYVQCHLVTAFSGDGEVDDWRSKQAVCEGLPYYPVKVY
jgi:hypothetical protein